MNFGRLAAAALVSWLAHLALTSVIWGMVLPDLFRQNAALMRAPSDMNLVLGYGASLAGFFVFSYAYAKGYEGGAGLVEGLRYGVLIGLLLAVFAGVWGYVMMPISAVFAAAMIVDSIVEMAAYGVIVGLIYRPVARRR
jgi:hypothetical protein